MTQPELKVEPDELLARAKLLETFVLADAFPKDCYPQGPCTLDVVVRARNKIWDSVDTLRDSVREGDVELRLMAEELITTAKEYEECDQDQADAITLAGRILEQLQLLVKKALKHLKNFSV